jgi:hypothetical protein
MSAWRLRSAAEDVKKTGLAIYAMIPFKKHGTYQSTRCL